SRPGTQAAPSSPSCSLPSPHSLRTTQEPPVLLCLRTGPETQILCRLEAPVSRCLSAVLTCEINLSHSKDKLRYNIYIRVYIRELISLPIVRCPRLSAGPGYADG